jgi:ACT domain-containing protein
MARDVPTHVVTVLTPDRVGIIASVAAVFARCNVNIIDASQTVLHGVFTIIFGVDAPAEVDVHALAEQVRLDLGEDVNVLVRPYTPPTEPVHDAERYMLTSTGPDGVGITHRLATICARHGGNFSDLYTHVAADRYTLIAELVISRAIDIAALRAKLESECTRAGLTVRLQHARLFAATTDITFHRDG